MGGYKRTKKFDKPEELLFCFFFSLGFLGEEALVHCVNALRNLTLAKKSLVNDKLTISCQTLCLLSIISNVANNFK